MEKGYKLPFAEELGSLEAPCAAAFSAYCLAQIDSYLGSHYPLADCITDISIGWVKKLGENIRLSYASDPLYEGSWAMIGLEEWYQRIFNEREKEFLEAQKV